MEPAILEQQDRINQAITANRWSQVSEAWEELLSENPQPLEFHKPIVDRLIRKAQHPEKLPALYEKLFKVYLEKNGTRQILQIAEYILRSDEKAEWLRLPVLQAIRVANPEMDPERVTDLINRSGLQDENTSVRRGLQRFDDLMGASKGQVFSHRTWGLGVVKELRPAEGKVIIDFQTRKAQEMTLDGVRNFLLRIPQDHIQARMVIDPDGLRELAKREPIDVVKLSLSSTGGRIKIADMKRLLTTRFLTEDEYKSFWNNARKAIKVDTMIEQVGTGVHGELRLRDAPMTLLDEVIKLLTKATTASARFEVLRDVNRHIPDEELTADDRAALFHLYSVPLKDGSITSEGDLLEHGLLFDYYRNIFSNQTNPVDVSKLLAPDHLVANVRHLTVPDLRREALDRIKDNQPDSWQEYFADVIVSLDPRTAAWVVKELQATKNDDHYYHVAVDNILAKPDFNPELFVWAARMILDGNWTHLADSIRPILIFEELLSLLAELEEQFDSQDKDVAARVKNHATRIRSLLNEKNCSYFRRAIKRNKPDADAPVKKQPKATTVDEARRILNTVRLHNALSAPLKSQMESLLLSEFDELRRVSRMEEEEENKKPSYHFTTRQSMEERRALLSRLIQQDIPAMSTVIETAREHGDLRENSEYHAAKEKQKLLSQQAAELEDLIARARVVDPEDITCDVSRFGTKVTLLDLTTNEKRQVTLMGMWEADVDNSIISYLTPFGKQLVNHRRNDEFIVKTPDGTETKLRLVDIELALTDTAAGQS